MSDLLEKSKKRMPHITTYNSDDSCDADELSGSQEHTTEECDDEDDDDNRPLSELRRLSKTPPKSNISSQTAGMNHIHRPSSPSTVSLSSESSSSAESDTEIDGLAETALDQLTAKFATVPVAELISSEEFRLLRKRIGSSRSKERPLSAYALFFKDMLPELKSNRPNIRFGEIVRLITSEWDSLPPLARKEYKLRGAYVNNKNIHTVLEYKTRLINLDSVDQRQCCNPSCANPVRADPRWNGQYCSAECVRDHCNLVFSKWLIGKRPNDCGMQRGPMVDRSDISKSDQLPGGSSSAPFVKKEDTQLDPENSTGQNATNPSQQHPESVGKLPSSTQPAVISGASSDLSVKPEDTYIPSTLTNRKSLFESLRTCPVSFSALTKETSKSNSVEFPKIDR